MMSLTGGLFGKYYDMHRNMDLGDFFGYMYTRMRRLGGTCWGG